VEDYQGRAAVRDCQGLSGVIGLLECEYPVIQELVLATLIQCSKDSESRESLRDSGGLQKIINFLQNKSYSDLHVHALHVLSNCLEDVATAQLLQSSGGLTSLLQYTQEATLPEVQQHAVRAIARAARNADNRRIFHEQETEKIVISLLNSNHCSVATAAAVALAVMAESANCKDTITKEDGINGLVKLLSHDESEAKEAALLALSTCTASSITNCRLVVDQGGLEHLVECLSHSKMSVQANAASCLANLATDESSRTDIHQQETSIPSLLAMLESCDSVVQSHGASALASLLCDSECRVELRGHGGVSVLISLLHSSNDNVRQSSGWALASCAVDPAIANEICALGGLDVLKELSESTSRQSQFTQLALDRLLDNCLPAKYWLTGQLSPTNIIEDNFYDMGQCYPGAKFLTLEDLCKQAVDQKRAILLINGREDKPAVSTVGQEVDHEGKSSEVVSPQKERSQSRSKGGKGKKTKSDKDHEAHGQSEERLTPQKPEDILPSWQPPTDPIFRSHIDHIRQNLLPLANAREQVEYLARFVSDQMGGTVDRSSITSFSYELAISEVKYELKSNVVAIGHVKQGTFYHRALLFKALADRVAVSCSLVRGDYNRAWNVVLIPEKPQSVGGRNVQFPPQKYVVDLMHHPGRLMAEDTQEAVQYQHV
jgi:HEAT repeat protein